MKLIHKKVFYINDENNLNFSIDETLRRLNKNKHLKKVFDSITDFKIETLKNVDGEIFQQNLKLKYIIDDVTDIRKLSFSFYGNKFMLMM